MLNYLRALKRLKKSFNCKPTISFAVTRVSHSICCRLLWQVAMYNIHGRLSNPEHCRPVHRPDPHMVVPQVFYRLEDVRAGRVSLLLLAMLSCACTCRWLAFFALSTDNAFA